MGSQGSNDDCYFYYYSSCAKGSNCPFRHCEAALGTETVCCKWREGTCFRANCKFRHMESRINRATIPCYWENQPGGCRKPHCVFLHQRARTVTNPEAPGLILPVTNNNASVTSKANETKDVKILVNISNENKSPEDDVGLSTSAIDSIELHPVEPIVVSFDEGEESDSESVSSTPMKCSDSKTISSSYARKNLSGIMSEKGNEKDFGIKTLEQIKMEKIHKESEHFYKSDTTDSVINNKSLVGNRNQEFLNGKIFTISAYDAPVIDSSSLKLKADSCFNEECYPPESEFIHLDRPLDKSVNNDSGQLPSEKERDLRNRLKRKFPLYTDNGMMLKTSPPAKKVVSLKKNKDDDPLNFKIKTLDEIRKERENKLSFSGNNQEEKTNKDIVSVKQETSQCSSSPQTTHSSNTLSNGKSRKLKLRRHSNQTSSIAKYSEKNEEWDNRPQMVLHEVQNISENQENVTVKDSTPPLSPGKKRRNEESNHEVCNKVLKVESNSNGVQLNKTENISSNSDNPTKKVRRPVIRRNFQPSLSSLPKRVENKRNSLPESDQLKSPVSKTATEQKNEHLAQSITSTEKDKRSSRSTSVDDLDSLFLNDGDINLEDVEDNAEAEDILLEIEQLLES